MADIQLLPIVPTPSTGDSAVSKPPEPGGPGESFDQALSQAKTSVSEDKPSKPQDESPPAPRVKRQGKKSSAQSAKGAKASTVDMPKLPTSTGGTEGRVPEKEEMKIKPEAPIKSNGKENLTITTEDKDGQDDALASGLAELAISGQQITNVDLADIPAVQQIVNAEALAALAPEGDVETQAEPAPISENNRRQGVASDRAADKANAGQQDIKNVTDGQRNVRQVAEAAQTSQPRPDKNSMAGTAVVPDAAQSADAANIRQNQNQVQPQIKNQAQNQARNQAQPLEAPPSEKPNATAASNQQAARQGVGGMSLEEASEALPLHITDAEISGDTEPASGFSSGPQKNMALIRDTQASPLIIESALPKQDSGENRIQAPADEPAPQVAESPATEKAAEKADEEASEKIGEKATEKSGEKANEKVGGNVGEKAAAEKASEKVGEKAADKARERAGEKAGEKVAEKAGDKSGDKASEVAGEKVGEKASGKAAERATERVAERTSEATRGVTEKTVSAGSQPASQPTSQASNQPGPTAVQKDAAPARISRPAQPMAAEPAAPVAPVTPGPVGKEAQIQASMDESAKIQPVMTKGPAGEPEVKAAPEKAATGSQPNPMASAAKEGQAGNQSAMTQDQPQKSEAANEIKDIQKQNIEVGENAEFGAKFNAVRDSGLKGQQAPEAKAPVSSSFSVGHGENTVGPANASMPVTAPSQPATAAQAAPKQFLPPNAPMAQLEGSVRWLLRTDTKGAEIQLHPENLGRVTVSLRVDGSQVHARVWATEASTMPLLENHKAFLESSLKEQGLNLSSFDLQHGKGGGQHAQGEPQHRNHFTAPMMESWTGTEFRQELPTQLVAQHADDGRIELYA